LRFFGRVKQEGNYPASNSLYQVLQLAGGFGDPVYRRSINENEIIVLRKDETKFYSKKFIVSYDDSRDFKLVVSDKIFVYETTNYNNSFILEVKGQVNYRGIYPYETGITVGEALNNAGGMTELANPQSIILVSEIQKVNEFGEISVDMLRVSDVDLNTRVATNSQIEILPVSFSVNVEGNVFDPGLVKFNKRNNLKDYIRLAGGVKKFTEFGNIYVKHANGKVSKPRMWRLFNGSGIKIMGGDQIIVPRDENAEDFDLTSFSADLATIIANVVGVLLMTQSISEN
jgi:protein involved in polysaccharide export with SLBB domain